MKKITIWAGIAAVFWAGLFSACGKSAAVYETAAVSAGSGAAAAEETPVPEEPETIFVYICGAVRNPGVYELPSGSRVFSAVEAAGGMTEEAEARSLNQAEILEDGQQITVYTEEEAEKLPESGGSESAGVSGRVNLNTATREALMTLPGIGEAKAQAVLDYREEHGDFQRIEDIQKVEGIKEKVYEKIKEQIEV